MQFHGTLSATFQDSTARGLGLLWDFCQARGEPLLEESRREHDLFLPTLLGKFSRALLAGTIENDEVPSGLFWSAMHYPRAKELVRAIEKFAEWCAARQRLPGDITSDLIPSAPADFTDLLVASRLCQTSMLAHLGGASRRLKGAVSTTIRDQRGQSVEPVKHFPSVRMIDLLWVGYARRGRDNDPDFFARDTISAT